ncbi:Centrosomal protein of 44 kDa [Lobulomyces angularis]|nr:Centrosomal protein of 44 kDa [Lobulomyces angularis]
MQHSTGDIKNNLRKLQLQLKSVNLSQGDPGEFLPLIHHILLNFSPKVSNYFLQKDYQLFQKNDKKFLELTFMLCRNEFQFKPKLSQKQFFQFGFAEVKIFFLLDLIKFCKGLKENIKRKSSNQNLLINSNNSNENHNNQNSDSNDILEKEKFGSYNRAIEKEIIINNLNNRGLKNLKKNFFADDFNRGENKNPVEGNIKVFHEHFSPERSALFKRSLQESVLQVKTSNDNRNFTKKLTTNRKFYDLPLQQFRDSESIFNHPPQSRLKNQSPNFSSNLETDEHEMMQDFSVINDDINNSLHEPLISQPLPSMKPSRILTRDIHDLAANIAEVNLNNKDIFCSNETPFNTFHYNKNHYINENDSLNSEEINRSLNSIKNDLNNTNNQSFNHKYEFDTNTPINNSKGSVLFDADIKKDEEVGSKLKDKLQNNENKELLGRISEIENNIRNMFCDFNSRIEKIEVALTVNEKKNFLLDLPSSAEKVAKSISNQTPTEFSNVEKGLFNNREKLLVENVNERTPPRSYCEHTKNEYHENFLNPVEKVSDEILNETNAGSILSRVEAQGSFINVLEPVNIEVTDKFDDRNLNNGVVFNNVENSIEQRKQVKGNDNEGVSLKRISEETHKNISDSLNCKSEVLIRSIEEKIQRAREKLNV